VTGPIFLKLTYDQNLSTTLLLLGPLALLLPAGTFQKTPFKKVYRNPFTVFSPIQNSTFKF
jgi:hypothetical protein